MAETNKPLTDADLTLRPKDTITWEPKGVHRIRFGGEPRPGLTLTSFPNVQKILDIPKIDPPLKIDDADPEIARGQKGGQKVTATVKDNADTSGVTEFSFTCGFSDGHADEMATVSFKIAPPAAGGGAPRSVEITTTNDPPLHRWLLLKTPDGDKGLTRP